MSIIKIEDLNKGDEILVASNGDLRRLRLTRQPRINSKRRWGGNYSTVMCDILGLQDLSDYTIIRTMYQDLNYRGIWLIKKANE